MNALDHRKAKRLQHIDTIMITDESSGYYYGLVNNVSGEGMYFLSEHAFKTGERIGIRFENPPFKTVPKRYRAVVRWCKPLSEEDPNDSFGIGVKYS